MYGTEIKKYLKEHGIRYSFLADKLGINRKTLYTALNSSRMDVDFYSYICEALKLDMYYFVNIVRKKSGNPETVHKERK